MITLKNGQISSVFGCDFDKPFSPVIAAKEKINCIYCSKNGFFFMTRLCFCKEWMTSPCFPVTLLIVMYAGNANREKSKLAHGTV